MPYRPARPVSIAANWSRWLGQFSLMLALIAWLFHRSNLLSLPNMVAVILLAAVIALLVLGLSAIGFVMLWLSGAKGGRASFAGLVMACLVLGPVCYAASRYLLLPPIADVSTDTAEPPEWIEPPQFPPSWLGRHEKITPVLRKRQLEAWPELTGRRYDGAMDRVFAAVNAAAEAGKWQLVAETGTETEAEFLMPESMPEKDLIPDGEESPARILEGDNTGKPLIRGDAAGFALPENGPLPMARPDLSAETKIANLSPVVVVQYSHRSQFLGVSHDIVVRLIEEEQTTFVDVRAATHYGKHDLGLNANLIAGFLRELDIALLGISGS